MRCVKRQTRRVGRAHRAATIGFSLTEALVALLLVGLLGSMIVAGIPAARNVYNSLLRSENAEAVCTTVSSRIAAELEDATECQMVDGTPVFVSHSGSVLDGLRIGISTENEDSAGQAVVTYYTMQSGSPVAITSGTYAPEPLLPDDAYVLGLKARATYALSGSTIKLTVSIYYDDANKPLATQDLTVALGSVAEGTSVSGGGA